MNEEYKGDIRCETVGAPLLPEKGEEKAAAKKPRAKKTDKEGE